MLPGFWILFLLIFTLQVNASNIFNFSDEETFPPDLNSHLQHWTCSGRIALSIANPLYERPRGYFECTFHSDYLEQCYDEGEVFMVKNGEKW